MNNLITRIVLSLKNRETRKQYLIMLTLYLLMFINEAYMHYEVYVTHYTPFACGMAFYYWGMDIIVILFFFNLVTWGSWLLYFHFVFLIYLYWSILAIPGFSINTSTLMCWANHPIFKVHGGLLIFHKPLDGAIYYLS